MIQITYEFYYILWNPPWISGSQILIIRMILIFLDQRYPSPAKKFWTTYIEGVKPRLDSVI